MTDKLKYPPLKPKRECASLAKTALAILLSASVLVPHTHAVETQWWFDVEVILFERNLAADNVLEKFEQSRLEHSDNNYLDLLTPYLKPDLRYLRGALNYCRASNRLAVQTQYEKDFAFPMPIGEDNELATSESSERLSQIDSEEQNLSSDVVENTEENFEYQVATTDIFAQSDNPPTASKITNTKDTNIVELSADVNLIRPPIRVDYIEWQIPSELPCAYSEQIDPTFASMPSAQNTELDNPSSNIITRVPEVINGTQWQTKRGAFLLPRSTMRMGDLYEKIKKQRNITPILHVNWRQQVNFGRDNGQTVRLFAGQNYAAQFDVNGAPLVEDTDSLFESLNQPTEEFYIPEEELALLSPEQQQALKSGLKTSVEPVAEDLFARIEEALVDDTPLEINQLENQNSQPETVTNSAKLSELWQLDGGITVYLRNVGRIPYLHIDSDLDFRRPIIDPEKSVKIDTLSANLNPLGAVAVNQVQQPNYLQSVNFNQLRRVISKQVHYFDHPLFGMVVRINRYRWPEVESEPKTELD